MASCSSGCLGCLPLLLSLLPHTLPAPVTPSHPTLSFSFTPHICSLLSPLSPSYIPPSFISALLILSLCLLSPPPSHPPATSSSTSKLKPTTRWYVGSGQVPPSPGVASLQPSLSPGPRSPSSHTSILGSVGEIGKPRGVYANASQIEGVGGGGVGSGGEGGLEALKFEMTSASWFKHTGLDVMEERDKLTATGRAPGLRHQCQEARV